MRWILFCTLVIFTIGLPQENSDCMECHSDPDLTGLNSWGTEISMFVDLKKFSKSIHGDLNCIDCHQDLEGVKDFPHEETLQPVNCANCHEDVANEYSRSMHGLKFVHMEKLAPKCSDCHGTHNILPTDDPSSTTYFQNLPNTCGDCHESLGTGKEGNVKQPRVRSEYLLGVHGKMVLDGNDAAPTCDNCHPAHSIRKRIDPQSTIFKLNIGKTCGTCHIDELQDFSESIHGKALQHGILESATCTDCHGEHKILSPDSAHFSAAHDACINCHNDTKLIKKYGLPATVVSTYEDSYHGRSVRLKRKGSATCASCHGYHDIHSAEDPFSSVNKANLVKTCSKCHKNVTESFANSYTHEAMLIQGNPINYYITLIYIILIGGVIGAMFLHNLIIFIKYIKYKRKDEKQFYVVRFKPAEVLQHALLMLSFTTLVITGFALRFPDAWWVKILEWMGINEVLRGLIHRGAAVVLIATSTFNLYYIIATKRGRHLLKQIMIKLQDIPEIIQTLKYYLGLSKRKPQYEEFDYTEKVEYWSLVWGNIVMGVTGIILWFPTLVTGFAQSWTVRAAELIHYYEAILATLAILIFHLFFVIFHPEQYPMNLSWLTGKMSLKAAIRKHPKWIERLFREKEDVELLPEVIRANCLTLSDVDNFMKFGGKK